MDVKPIPEPTGTINGDSMKRSLMLLAVALTIAGCNNTSSSESKISETVADPVAGECPADYPIKGNQNTKGEWIYHMPSGQYYDRTDAEECFATEQEAVDAGYRATKR